jgi:hypothetical protein
MPERPTGYLSLEAGRMVRTSRATATGSVRFVTISNCSVTQWFIVDDRDKKLIGKNFKDGEQFNVTVMEAKPGELHWKEDPEKIGALDREYAFCNVFLPPVAFAHFWSGADGLDDSIELELKSDGPDNFAVTNVGFFEPGARPVVTHIRSVRDVLKGSVVMLFIFGVILGWALAKIFHWSF